MIFCRACRPMSCRAAPSPLLGSPGRKMTRLARISVSAAIATHGSIVCASICGWIWLPLMMPCRQTGRLCDLPLRRACRMPNDERSVPVLHDVLHRHVALPLRQSASRAARSCRCAAAEACLYVRIPAPQSWGALSCVAVTPPWRGKHIVAHLVREGTRALKQRGMRTAFLGYTHSGLERLYGLSGHEIYRHSLMAHKPLASPDSLLEHATTKASSR